MKIRRWELVGFLFTVIFGSLLHFFYQWSGECRIIGVFAPVNESSWEHLKLIFVPMLLFSVAEFLAFGKSKRGFLPIKVMAVLLGMGLILILFYTYTGIIGENFLVADILTFIIAVAAAYRYSCSHLQKEGDWKTAEIVCAWITLLILAACFVLFTFYPPHIGLFLDPVSGTYGIAQGWFAAVCMSVTPTAFL